MAKRKTRSSARRSSAAATSQPMNLQETASTKTIDLGAEYKYVLSDLGQIGLIAAGLIAGLVILSFFL